MRTTESWVCMNCNKHNSVSNTFCYNCGKLWGWIITGMRVRIRIGEVEE